MTGNRRSGLVLADDATGALECASLLAGLGIGAAIAFAAKSMLAEGVLVVDTESRHLAAAEAGERVERWAAQGDRCIFKKTDSTLRGNIGAELLALLSQGPVVYLPAYPALGRTVRHGHLYVDGIAVHKTEFGQDLRHPVRTSAIAELFPALTTELIPDVASLQIALTSGRRKVLICDAETDQDLEHFAAILPSQRVSLAGPANIVKLWVNLNQFPGRPTEAWPTVRQWLVVCGSRHPRSRRQAVYAASQGIAVLSSPLEAAGPPETVAEDLARQASERIAARRPDGILIMGGDTAWALWQALGIVTLEPLPEVLPGVAACRSGELLFVTKAGGFGGENLVEQVVERFS